MTTQNTQAPQIFAALAQSVAEIGVAGVSKDGKNSFQKFNYRSIDGALTAFNRVFARNKVFMTTTIKEKTLVVDSGVYRLDLWLEYTFIHQDGSSVKGDTFCSNSGKDVSKLTGQITSYALKEYLFKNFFVPCEGADDIDGRDERGVPKVDSVMPVAYTTWKSAEDGINWAITKGMTKSSAESLLGSVEPDSRGRKSQAFFYAVEALNSPKK